MGRAKEQMLHEHDQQSVATDIAIKAGVLTQCRFHENIYDPLNGDNTPAYELGEAMLAKGELSGLFSSVEEVKGAIDAAVDDAGMDCYDCEKEKAS